MTKEPSFFKLVCRIAIPITLQSMLQSSFSIVDQIMIGQLGSTNIAGIGLAGKFASIYSVLLASIAAVSGIMIAQYIGQNNEAEEKRSFSINLSIALILAGIFTFLSIRFANLLMKRYTSEEETALVAASYLQILAFTFLPMAGSTLISTLLRCREKAAYPLYASIIAACVNTGLNYVLIFGKLGFQALGVKGAALATVIAQLVNFLLIFIMYQSHKNRRETVVHRVSLPNKAFNARQYIAMLFPIMINEFLWSLGENVYAMIYGKMGTHSCAAMILTNPIQGLLIGALSGVSAAAGIIIGKSLGNSDYDKTYQESKKLMFYGFCGSIILSILLLIMGRYYVLIYQVEPEVRTTAYQILLMFAIISPVKVQNMVLGGGILRSGGKTQYVMCIDIIGTWVFGVPLGLCAAFVWKFSIPYVYLILSLEECIRFGISLVIFQKRSWMRRISDT